MPDDDVGEPPRGVGLLQPFNTTEIERALATSCVRFLTDRGRVTGLWKHFYCR